MPLTTFTPPMRPSAGTGIASEVSLRKAPFGDGYTQASPAGLNHVRLTVTLRWDYLSLAEAMAIDTFLKARGGYEPFYYRLNGETADRKWTCSEWSITDGMPARLTATFREDFTTAV